MSKVRTRFTVGFVVVLILGFTIDYSVTQLKRNAASYLFGYPLVLMEQTREVMTNLSVKKQLPNHFTHIQLFPDHTFHSVVRPNNDTLYSVAWLDLAPEPVILSVPDTQGRYYVMPFMDAWTNVFASVGKRTTGTKPGSYALTGPGWKGVLPEGVQAISAPNNMVWLIGRIQTNGVSDVKNVAVLQEEFLLTPLSRWREGVPNPHVINTTGSKKSGQDPARIVEDMMAGEFFNRLATMMGEQPAKLPADGAALESLAGLNVLPGENFDINNLNLLDRYLLEKSMVVVNKRVREEIKKSKNLENGWKVHREFIGNYGTNYEVRAGVAMFGLGALPPEEAAYPNTNVDSEGRPLTGEYLYRIHFPAGETPPVDAFWSLSMYNDRGFFVDNPIRRYTIGGRDALDFNDDGSLDLFIQQEWSGGNDSNWLPAPEGTFALTMRIYNPKSSFFDGSWKLPFVERVN